MHRGLLTFCVAFGLSVLATAHSTQAGHERHSPRPAESRAERPSLDEAVSNVRRETGGRVLSAEKRHPGRDSTYRIKVLLPNASVRSFDVDAEDHERRDRSRRGR